MEVWLVMLGSYLLVFCAQLVYMALDCVRVLMLTRGRKWLAGVVGFFEISVFILVLDFILKDGIDDPGKFIAYAAGFAAGNLVGSIIEERMAMGFVSLQVFPPTDQVDELTARFRKAGFGVTRVTGEGRDGHRKILFLFLDRKELNRALHVLKCYDPNIFFSVSDARLIRGGIIPGRCGVAPGRQ